MAGSRFSWRSIFSCYGRVGDSAAAGSAAGKKRQRSPPRAEPPSSDHRNPPPPFSPEELSLSLAGSNLHDFTLAELQSVTNNFSTSQRIGEGGFGPVFKGYVDDKLRPGLKPQHVAVKLLDHEGLQGHKEWLAEVMFLGQLRHRHLVKLIGYCCENEQRLLVYEFVSRGSLESHLFKRFFAALPWKTRIKIAIGAAKGLAFLHEAEKPVIYRDFKASNILLESDYTAKLSDFGLAKDGPEGEETHVSTRVMGTEGYAAPEYVMTGHLNSKSDVYSFGVVMLELLSGRRCLDKSRPSREQNLVDWARPWLTDSRRLRRVIDPKLDDEYPAAGAQKLAELASLCLSHTPKNRPTMKAVVETLEPLLLDEVPAGHFVYTVSSAETSRSDVGGEKGAGDGESGQRLESKRDGDHAGDQTSTEVQEDGNRVRHRRRKPEPRENGHKIEAKEHRSDHRHHHHHASGHRSRTSKPEAYTDTALYKKTHRHNHERGS